MKLNRSELTVAAIALVGSLTLLAIALLVIPLIATAAGAFTGLVVGWAFNDTYAAVAGALGITLPLWQVGAALGFLGGFIKRTVRFPNKKQAED